jgi:hypothetical protein
MTTLCLSHRKNEKFKIKKYDKVMSKLKLKNKASANENLLLKCIETYFIYIYNFLNDVIVVNFYP